MYPYIITEQKVTVVIDGKPFAVYVDDNASLFDNIIKAIKSGVKETVASLINPAKVVEDAVSETSEITYEHGYVWYRGVQVNNYVVDKILALKRDGFDVTRLEKFLTRLYSNPNKEVIPYLYEFLEYGGQPITEDGKFLAFKRVRSNYTDIHSGKFDNSPGKIVEEARELVNSDRNTACARGLHFCSWEYLSHFGSASAKTDRVVIVEIDPADVVMIPSDYNNTKARCCKYKVLYDFGKPWGEIEINALKNELNRPAVNVEPENVEPVSGGITNVVKHAVQSYFGEGNIGIDDDLDERYNIDALDVEEILFMIEDDTAFEICTEVFNIVETWCENREYVSINNIAHTIIKFHGKEIFSKLSKEEQDLYNEHVVKKNAATQKVLPNRGPDGRFISKKTEKAEQFFAAPKLGEVRSGMYWNGASWVQRWQNERMRTADGRFMAGQFKHSDGYFYKS
jgi:acyl carrier protein